MPTILHVLETCVYGRDLSAMERFYSDVLGLRKMSADYPRHVFFKISDASVLLVFNPDETIKKQDIPSHGGRGPGHVAFAIPRDELDAWRVQLKARDVDIEKEVGWGNGAKSLYMRDPAGNSVELVTPQIWSQGQS